MKRKILLWASISNHALEDKSKARKYLQRVIKMDPSYRWASLLASERKLLE